jgi:hypothetical protein
MKNEEMAPPLDGAKRRRRAAREVIAADSCSNRQSAESCRAGDWFCPRMRVCEGGLLTCQ